ncbi:hypothetical protein M422DRAFT_270190 [Sphaerobolus stellatus SS14]|uniref:Unplaced genomic scaffold SPHSTscaffold_229, whole genome shotgun sequence n=1 Tax=Sphaerobolus stellatus (strain SS14) TaxID=990650 RepID=A0A0C9TGF3_SPHS4|nr:hypothetical protein M422DRAFT_270190 [Sphaerobolus stellatus SS14]
MPTNRPHTPIPPLIEPILHEEPRLRFETFEYHPSYPGNNTFPVPERTEAAITLKELWQPIVDKYWNTVREWIAAKNSDREAAIARKEAREAKERAEREAKEAEEKAEREAEKERLKRKKVQERDERVAKSLEGRKRKRSEKDVGNSTLKKKKRAPKPKSAPTIVEPEDEDDGGREAQIIVANRKSLLKKGVDIVDENSLGVVHKSSNFLGNPREEPCNRCRYWVKIRGCATWICREVAGRKACATCTASNVPCATTGEAIQREKKGDGTPKRRASGSKAEEEGRPEIFDRLGFVEADLETLKQTVSELRDLTRIQVMSQLLTYRLFEANNAVRPPGFQEQREVYRRSVTKVFGKDHLGEDEGRSDAIGDEEDASGEEDEEVGLADETLGRSEDMENNGEVVLGDMESEGELDQESEEGSATEGETATPKTKNTGPSIVESEESGETSGTTSGEEESGGESEENGNYLPVKGKKSGKDATKV